MSAIALQIRKAALGSLIRDVEPEHVAPEPQTRCKVGDSKLRHKGRESTLRRVIFRGGQVFGHVLSNPYYRDVGGRR